MQINISVSAIVLLLLLLLLLLAFACCYNQLNSGCIHRHGKGRRRRRSKVKKGYIRWDEGGGGKRLAFRFIVVYDPFGWWNVRNAPCALISTHTIAAGAFVIIHAYALVSVVSFSLAIGFGSARPDPCLSSFFLTVFLLWCTKENNSSFWPSSLWVYPFLSPR